LGSLLIKIQILILKITIFLLKINFCTLIKLLVENLTLSTSGILMAILTVLELFVFILHLSTAVWSEIK